MDGTRSEEGGEREGGSRNDTPYAKWAAWCPVDVGDSSNSRSHRPPYHAHCAQSSTTNTTHDTHTKLPLLSYTPSALFFIPARFLPPPHPSKIVDASSMRDIMEASAYETYTLPKLYIKQYYCIDAAVHQRLVRGRSKEDRKIRTPPERFRPKPEKKA